MTALWIGLGVGLLLLIWLIVAYNRFVRLRNHIEESSSDIDVELKRRHDLIPNLVSTVKGFAAHEASLLTRIVELRNEAHSQGGAPASRSGAETALMLGMKQLFAVVEGYPDLKSDQHFLALQEELALTEDRIAAARRFLNGNVRELRNLRESFPTSIVANMFGFKDAEFFELSNDAERVVPRPDFH